MSRRIAYGALAAAFVLIAGPAQADRECFENSCRMPDVVEPPPPPPPAAAAEASAADKPATAPETGAASQSGAAHAQGVAAKPPAGVHPQMVVDPAPRKPIKQAQPVQPAPRRDANVDVGPARFPPRPAPRYPKHAPAVAAGAAPTTAGPKSAPARAPAYAAAPAIEGPAAAEVVIARTSGMARIVRIEPGVAPGYAILRPDPAWKRCQIDQGELAGQAYRCGPQSYHPYGAHGYRPYGTYRSYRSEPAYVLAPNAKIISIDSGD